MGCPGSGTGRYEDGRKELARYGKEVLWGKKGSVWRQDEIGASRRRMVMI
jgi:hypothetical protein